MYHCRQAPQAGRQASLATQAAHTGSSCQASAPQAAPPPLDSQPKDMMAPMAEIHHRLSMFGIWETNSCTPAKIIANW